MIRYYLTRQFLGFLFSGGMAAVMHWLARVLLSNWMPFYQAVLLAYPVGMAVAFLLNRKYVFPASLKSSQEQMRGFVLVNLFFFPLVFLLSVGLNKTFILLGFVEHAKLLAHGIAVAAPTLITFIAYKMYAFKDVCSER